MEVPADQTEDERFALREKIRSLEDEVKKLTSIIHSQNAEIGRMSDQNNRLFRIIEKLAEGLGK